MPQALEAGNEEHPAMMVIAGGSPNYFILLRQQLS
jgi:hypothetical protein